MKYPNIKRNQRDIIQSKTNQNQISNIITIEFMPLLLSHIAHPHYEIEITGSDGSTGVESIVEIIRFVEES